MQQDDDLEEHIHTLILELCAVLYYNGYRKVPIGAMMRLIGANTDHASKHDNGFFELDHEFEQILKEYEDRDKIENTTEMSSSDDIYRPPDATLH
jgi:hypothetical protein